MAQGTVKWFNTQKGYGFITPDAGGPDVFVHAAQLEKCQTGTLNENDRLEYELDVGNNGKKQAVKLKRI